MIARLVMMGAVLATCLLLETVVFPGLAVIGWRPHLVLLSVLAFGLVDGHETGLRYGFVAGIATDLLSGAASIIGMSALVLLLVGYGAGLARPFLAGSALAGLILVAGAATVVAVGAAGLLSALLGGEAPGAATVAQGAVVVGAYNAALAPFVLRPVAALARRFAGNPTAGSGATPSTPGARPLSRSGW